MTAKLRAAAMAATPGPWSTRAERARPRAIVVAGTEQVADAAEHVHWTDSQCEANAAYIASASPDVVIALLDQLDALRAALEEACDGWRQFVMHTSSAPRTPEWLARIEQLRAT